MKTASTTRRLNYVKGSWRSNLPWCCRAKSNAMKSMWSQNIKGIPRRSKSGTGTSAAFERDSGTERSGQREAAIRGSPHLRMLTGTSLLGGLPPAWPRTSFTATNVLESLIEHWRIFGLPGFTQFDNNNRFTGPRQYLDAEEREIRLCLSLRVTPVFAPPNETGFQAAIESFNGLWQATVRQRFEHPTLSRLRQCSDDYLAALRQRRAVRISEAPFRRPFPSRWKLDLQVPHRGRILFVRRTTDTCHATVLGHSYLADHPCPHRLVRAGGDLLLT